MKVAYNGVCDIGLGRQINQDRLYMMAKADTALFAIADGMGGHMHGEKASSYIINKVRNWYGEYDTNNVMMDFNSLVHSLQSMLEQTNREIWEFYKGNAVCGSTVVLFFAFQSQYALLWAGDSRAYVSCRRRFRQLTVDDVWENQTVIRKHLTARQIRDNVNCGKLINAIGVSQDVQIHIKTDELRENMRFLLCSDGLYKYCHEKEIRKMLNEYGGTKAGDMQMQSYLNDVYAGGAKDNVSFILISFII